MLERDNENLKGKDYTGGVDFAFLELHDVKIIKHQPWQLGLFHPDLRGKFVWYPRKGTLMFEWEFNGGRQQAKIGQTGDFVAGGFEMWRDKDATEKVYEQIMKKIQEQQNT